MRTTLTRVYRREGRWWAASIPELPGVNTQGRTLKEARENLLDAMTLLFESCRDADLKDESGGRIIRDEVVVDMKWKE